MALGTQGYPRTPQLLVSPFTQSPPQSSTDLVWSDEPPTPPPKGSKPFGFSAKMPSFSPPRNQSGRSTRSTESNSAEDHISIAGSSTSNGHRELRKPKSFMNPLNVIRRARSKVRLDADDKDTQAAINRIQPPLPTFVSSSSGDSSFLQMDPSPGKNTLRAVRGREKKKSKGGTTPHISSIQQPEFNIDLNLERMEGIIDPSLLVQSTNSTPISGAGFGEASTSSLRADGRAPTPSSSSSSPPHFGGPVFSDPFISRPPSVRSREGNVDARRMSPHTIVPALLPQQLVPPPTGSQDGGWKPPASWVTGDQPEPDVSSSEDEKASTSKRKARRRATVRALQIHGMDMRNFKIRVYRANSEYHILTCGLATTVGQLSGALNASLLTPGEREDHRLYLKERGRERMLAQTERPADIVRRRLEQAGYDVADGLDTLGEGDLSFLMKFVYKSTVLGPAEEDMIFTDYRNVDLTNKSLRTVPVVLYAHAEDIRSLTLSRNPMLDVPGDFVQLCTSLQELRLSNMSIKKVPQSVQNFTTLMGLDLSSNRIGDINDIALYRLPDLRELRVQNNRLEKLPWYFPRLHVLRLLNISNNKFQDVPDEVCKMSGLEELDISFNMISQLPEELQSLQRLKILIVVGNRVTRIPDCFRRLSNLGVLDCRRNNITELGAVSLLPSLEELLVSHNDVQALDLSSGPVLKKIDISHNDITQISLAPGPVGRIPVALTYLNVSSAKLSSLDDLALAQLTSLEELILDRNKFRAIPESLGDLSLLHSFSCSDNLIGALPSSIGRLQRLKRLDVHNNNLTELPAALWNCGSLERINMTSNVIAHIRLPSLPPASTAPPPLPALGISESALSSTVTLVPILTDRKASTTGSVAPSSRILPPLVKSLQRLYLGENRLTDDALPLLMILRELRVLNLSFNDFQELPRQFFKDVILLEELYLSGNKLAGLPTEDLPRLSKLEVLYLNGNRLLTLPQELGKVINLAVLDVGSNGLRYNISNWEFDWNWNFNKNLKYLNLSGNKHLRIQTWQRRGDREGLSNELLERLAGFEELNQLRVLGLMDVTTTLAVNIPDDTEDRRVRTSVTLVNQLQYGIADNLGNREYLTMFDLVQPAFREKRDEAVFAMFGRSHASLHNTHISKFLHDNFVSTFSEQLKALDLSKGESHPDALRRTFLKLNRLTHDHLFSAFSTTASGRKMSQASHRSAGTLLGMNATDAVGNAGGTSSIGASGIVAYFRGHHLYVANAGNALAVMSRRGLAHVVSVKHEPFDRNEITRVRAAEGWVSPKGLVNDEADVSRSFGYYHLLPIINARPDVSSLKLSELDEFLIIANNGLWDFVSYQTAVDIARSERADPMIAAQKLRDFAISYGSEGTTMIMVISLAGMFGLRGQEKDNPLQDVEFPPPRRNRKDEVGDNETGRLDPEIPPPVGQVVLAFTDIVNSTHMWDVNETAMRTAVTMHHQLLRRHVRICGGYEVKTEGDAFMVAFTTVSAALLWCSSVQMLLLDEPWPKEILDLPEGREVRDANGSRIARGLRLRMGIHCGTPVCEMDLVSRRMDYYGPMVNRASRVANSAEGGQILLSADALRELKAETEDPQLVNTVEALQSFDPEYINVGEKKLKGLEIPEVMTAVYPEKLLGRLHVSNAEQEQSVLDAPIEDGTEQGSTDDLSPVCSANGLLGEETRWTPEQVRELGQLTVRLQTLAGGRVFRPLPVRKGSRAQVMAPADADCSRFLYSDLAVLAPSLSERPSEAELIGVLDYLLLQLELVVESLSSRLDRSSGDAAEMEAIRAALASRSESGHPLDPGTLRQILELLGR